MRRNLWMPFSITAVLTALLLSSVPASRAADKDEAEKSKAEKKEKEKQAVISPKKADADFALQGEYSGELELQDRKVKHGVQIIALGDGKFRAVSYRDGLPGDGWNQTDKRKTEGKRVDGLLTFETENVKGVVRNETLEIKTNDGRLLGNLKKVHRKSPTLGKKAPEGAVVLFDGTTAGNFKGGRMTKAGLLMQGVTSKQTFQNFSLHMEFMLSYMPYARGQQRSNSGCYMQGRYEVQILDSFGLEGESRECGGIYNVRKPDLNMCFPPLTWQTYDIDFTAATFDDKGDKTANARLTVRQNGVLLHKDAQVPKSTRAAPLGEGPEPGPLFIQDHNNPLRFRNIWIVTK